MNVSDLAARDGALLFAGADYGEPISYRVAASGEVKSFDAPINRAGMMAQDAAGGRSAVMPIEVFISKGDLSAVAVDEDTVKLRPQGSRAARWYPVASLIGEDEAGFLIGVNG